MILTGPRWTKVLAILDQLERAERRATTPKVAVHIRSFLKRTEVLELEDAEHLQNLIARYSRDFELLVTELRAALTEADHIFARVERDRTSTRRVHPIGNVDLPSADAGVVRATIDSIDYK